MSADSRLRRAQRDGDTARAATEASRALCPCYAGWHPTWCEDADAAACTCRLYTQAPDTDPPMLPNALDHAGRCTLHDGWNLDDPGSREAFLAWTRELTLAGAWAGQPHRDLLEQGIVYASLAHTAQASRRAGDLDYAHRSETRANALYRANRLGRLGW